MQARRRSRRERAPIVLAPDVDTSATTTALVPADRPCAPPLHGVADLWLGLDTVKGLGAAAAGRIAAARHADGPFTSMTDLARRTGLNGKQLERLATAGALGSLEPDRRRALWVAGTVDERPGIIPGTGPAAPPPTLPGMSATDLARADYTGLGLSVDIHPMTLVRDMLDADGVLTVRRLPHMRHGKRIEIAGIVTHRQRPSTAKGSTFLSLEDETGIANVVCSPGLWNRWHEVATIAKALRIRGTIEKAPDAHASAMPMVVAYKLVELDLHSPSTPSLDFR